MTTGPGTGSATATRYVNIIVRFDRLTPDEACEVSAMLKASRLASYGMRATRGEYDDFGSYGLRVGERKRIT